MKSRINKILGVVVTLTILASLVVTGTALPASAAVGTLDWGSVSAPSNIGNVIGGKTWPALTALATPDVDFLASTADGKTMFAWDETSDDLYKSTDGGITWSPRAATATGITLASNVVGIVISPAFATDNTVAIATQDASVDPQKVWLSTDGGGNFAEVATADLKTKIEGGVLTSIDMGVYYADGAMSILVGCTAVGAGAVSNVLKFKISFGVGGWTEVGGLTVAGVGDFSAFAVKFSPAHTADSEIMVVVNNAAGVAVGTPTLYSSFAGANFANPVVIPTGVGVPTSAMIVTGTDYQGLSSNTLAIGINGGASADIYRVAGRSSGAAGTATDRNALGAGAANIKSIAINGPIATATVLVGTTGSANVYRNATFTGTTTTFAAASKAPTGAANASVVWAGTNAVVGTTGADSAISVSSDGGVNFNQTSLIDVGTFPGVTNTDIQVADANNMALIQTNASAGALITKYLWVTADGGATWKKVMNNAAAGPVFNITTVALSPAYATDKTIFVSQGTAGGASVMIFKSADNGNSFTPMIASDLSTTIVAIDGTTYYYGGNTAATFYKYGRFTSGTFPTGTAGSVFSIAFNPKDTTKATIAVGMTNGEVYQSTNDGVSFTKVGATAGGAENMFVAYGPDGSLYTLGAAGTGVRRYAGTAWLTLQAVPLGRGLVVTKDGTLYAADATAGVGVFRSLYPTLGDTTSIIATEFQALNTANFAGWGAAYVAADLDVAVTATDNTLFVVETTSTTATSSITSRPMGFKDTLIVGPTLTTPADKAQVTTQTTAALAWTAFASATAYEVQVNSAAAFTGTASTIASVTAVGGIANGRLTNSATAGTTAAPLTGGNTYYWRIRVVSSQVAAAPANTINGRWSVVRYFITALPPPVVTTIQSPTMGSVDVTVDTTFTWPTVAGTGVTYEFVIAEELGNADKFAIIDYSATTTTNAHKLREDLKFNTQYWWRVRAVTASSKSDWTVGFFTTEKEPVVTTPTATTPPVTQTIVVPTQTIPPFPTPTVTVNVPQDEPTEVIPTYLLWAVIAVGAILIIAVIVLIVRTRRIS